MASDTTNTTNASIAASTTDMETPTQAWALLGISMALAIFHVPVCVGAYRVSRDMSMFILFFSESLTNAILLVSSVASSQVLLIGKNTWTEIPLLTAVRTNGLMTLLQSLLTYSSLMHALLIASNRAFSVLFPLQYSAWWTRRVILTATLSVWAANFLLKGVEGAVSVVMSRGQPVISIDNFTVFSAIYTVFQPAMTYASLALYTISLVWVVLRRRMTAGLQSLQPVRVRVFAYCLLSFLPNCYFIVAIQIPAPGTFAFWLYTTARLSVNGILLVVMSSMVRTRMPLLNRLWGVAVGRKNTLPTTLAAASPEPRGSLFWERKRTLSDQQRLQDYRPADTDTKF